MQEDGVEVVEGEVGAVVGHIGATGRPRGTMSAHLHFSVFKKLPTKLDMIATNKATLEEYWVDPLWFFKQLEGEQSALDVCLTQHLELVNKCSDKDKEIAMIQIALETEEQNHKDTKTKQDEFLRDMVNILDPNVGIAIADVNLVKNLAKLVVQQFSDIQSELKKKTNEWSTRETELIVANAQLKENLERITKDLREISERHASEMEEMKKKHSLELTIVKKHLDKVTADTEKLEEQQIENDKVKQFIEVIKSFFERKK